MASSTQMKCPLCDHIFNTVGEYFTHAAKGMYFKFDFI